MKIDAKAEAQFKRNDRLKKCQNECAFICPQI